MDNKINNNELRDVTFKPNKFGGFVFFWTLSVCSWSFFFNYFSLTFAILSIFFTIMALKFFVEREVQ